MGINEKVLVRSFPYDPLVRQIYAENGNSVLVWRGTVQPDDLPAPCPRNNVFVLDYELITQLKEEIAKGGLYSLRLKNLWEKAKPYYKRL